MIKSRFTIALCGLLFSLFLISCKKEYTCTCVQTSTTTAYTQYSVYHPQTTTASTYRNTYKAKKNEAESWCDNSDDYNVTTYGSGEAQRTMTNTVECEN